MLPTTHLKDEVKPGQIPLTFINLSHYVAKVAKHTIIGSLGLYVDNHKLKDLEMHSYL